MQSIVQTYLGWHYACLPLAAPSLLPRLQVGSQTAAFENGPSATLQCFTLFSSSWDLYMQNPVVLQDRFMCKPCVRKRTRFSEKRILLTVGIGLYFMALDLVPAEAELVLKTGDQRHLHTFTGLNYLVADFTCKGGAGCKVMDVDQSCANYFQQGPFSP